MKIPPSKIRNMSSLIPRGSDALSTEDLIAKLHQCSAPQSRSRTRMLLCKQVHIALWRQSLSWLRCFVYVKSSRMKLLWVAIRGTRKGRFNSYMLILIAHQRESINHNQFPATVSLLCDHHTQLLSLNCIPFLPFSPWWAQFTIWLYSLEWISSLLTLCDSCFIVSGATPLRLSPMSPSTFREQAGRCTKPGVCIV